MKHGLSDLRMHTVGSNQQIRRGIFAIVEVKGHTAVGVRGVADELLVGVYYTTSSLGFP